MTLDRLDVTHEHPEHFAVLYESDSEYVDRVGRFVRDGVAAGLPVMVAVPEPRLSLLAASLNGSSERVSMVDMSVLGANPSRIIPTVREFLDDRGAAARFVGEPIWPGRSDAEVDEAVRHEALLNHAFADAPVEILCPYDVGRLPDRVLEDIESTHPLVDEGAGMRPSAGYADPREVHAALDRPLAAAPEGAAVLAIDGDMAALRAWLRGRAAAQGFSDRVEDLLLAVTEAATNSVLHGSAPRRLRVWADDGSLVCEVSDSGHVDDPLAGRRRPRPDQPTGRGLWIINQLSDLVELRSRPGETTLRIHMRSLGGTGTEAGSAVATAS